MVNINELTDITAHGNMKIGVVEHNHINININIPESNISKPTIHIDMILVERANFNFSKDWLVMKEQHNKLTQYIEKYPDNNEEFKIELAYLIKQMEDFKQDVFKLAEQLQRIPNNVDGFDIVYKHFQKGEFREARAIFEYMAQNHFTTLK